MTDKAETVGLALGPDAYDIHIGAGLLRDAGARLASALPGRRLCVVTDETVAGHYLVPLMKNLEATGFSACPPVILPPGEGTKTFARLEYLVDRILSYKPDRRTAIVALGGGVVGDIAGFAAAIILRGLPFAQVPTTLLAQVDSAVGGKTGINTGAGKNLVGSFYQPKTVLIDTDTLKTLPAREMRAGYAEIVKYALIGDPAFFAWLERHGTEVLAGEPEALKRAVAASCRAKAAIVAADAREEKDLRALLNLGHTFGHALEALGGYDGRLLHGEAVAIGMRMAFEFSARRGLCPEEDVLRVARHLERAGLPARAPFTAGAEEIAAAMRGDKKNADGRIALVLVRGIGRAFVCRDAEEAEITDFLRGRNGN